MTWRNTSTACYALVAVLVVTSMLVASCRTPDAPDTGAGGPVSGEAAPATGAEPSGGEVPDQPTTGGAEGAAPLESTAESGEEDASDPAAPPTTQIKGRITDPDGSPIVDVSVAVVSGTAPVPEMAVFTDAAGIYVWRVPAGTFTLEAYRDGYQTEEQEVTIEAGETITLDFTLTPR